MEFQTVIVQIYTILGTLHRVINQHLLGQIGIVTIGYYYDIWNSSCRGSSSAQDIFVVLMLIFCYILITLIDATEEKYNLINRSLYNEEEWISSDDFHLIHDKLPWHRTKPDVEGANWLNELMSQMWCRINASIKLLYLPKLLQHPTIQNLSEKGWLNLVGTDLTNLAPSITGIRVWDRGVKRDEIIVDMELQLDAKFNLRASSLSFINAGLERIYFRSKIRIILGSLITERPTIGTLSLTILGDAPSGVELYRHSSLPQHPLPPESGLPQPGLHVQEPQIECDQHPGKNWFPDI